MKDKKIETWEKPKIYLQKEQQLENKNKFEFQHSSIPECIPSEECMPAFVCSPECIPSKKCSPAFCPPDPCMPSACFPKSCFPHECFPL